MTAEYTENLTRQLLQQEESAVQNLIYKIFLLEQKLADS